VTHVSALVLTTLAAVAVAQPPALITVCVVDATTRAPLVGASIQRDVPLDSLGPHAIRLHRPCVAMPRRATASSRTSADVQANRTPPDSASVRRVAYHQARVDLSQAADTITVSLYALSSAVPLASMEVRASVSNTAIGHRGASVDVPTARERGVGSSTQLIERLPFTNVRSARGEAGLSLRGARREQVVVTLDGMPLNDPSTGVADLSDIPLAALGSATVVLGADPIGAGPGASGGVLALGTGAPSLLAMRAGSLSQRGAEGAWSRNVDDVVLHAAAMYRAAENDFVFANGAGASGTSTRERRVNNDERRGAGMLSAIGHHWQLAALLSHSDRGLVGPANVRANDADRARTDRVLLRGQADLLGAQARGGVRHFSLAYRDPARPVLDADADVWATELEVGGVFPRRGELGQAVGWRTGGGHDHVRASGGIAQHRRRAFVASQTSWQRDRFEVDAGARVDAVDGSGALPSFSLASEAVVTASWTLSARAAQAVRVPTLYDLYFASPQRLFVRTLRPERVTADLEVGTQWRAALNDTRVTFDLSVVSRDTRDAIVWFPGNFGWSPANVGLERLRGGEARAALSPRWGGLTTWVTWYDAQLTSGALRIPTPYVPRVSAGSEWIARVRGATASLYTRTMGRRPFSAGPRDPLFELPAVTLVDASLSHGLPTVLSPSRFSTMVTWSLENATNAAWQSVRGFPSPGRTWAIAITLRHTPQS